MSFNKVIVLIDMDGVLADFNAGFLEKFQMTFPDKPVIPLKDLKTFYIDEQYEVEFGTGAEARSIIESKGFFLDLPPIKGAINGINILSQCNDIEIFICTSPLQKFNYCVQEKYDWVAKNLGLSFVKKIILTRDKTVVNGHFLIDDKPKIFGLLKPSWVHLLFEASYNKHTSIDENQIKIKGWEDNNLLSVIREKYSEMNK